MPKFKKKKVVEAMTGKAPLKDERILGYIDDCIKEIKKINFNFGSNIKNELTFDDINVEEGETMHTFGTFRWPEVYSFSSYKMEGNSTLILNRQMFSEPEEAIKNTILHELCHYIVYKWGRKLGVYYPKNGDWFINRHLGDKSDWSSHGRLWRQVAAKVSAATGHDIKRTDSYATHTGVADYANSKYNYILKCKHCGNEFKYTRKTNFVKDTLAGNGHADNWWCNCGDGTKSQDFEIIKGK